VVAQKNYLVKPITFSGPCKSKSITVQISGSLVASDNPSDYKQDPTHWLMFDSVQKLSVKGGGTIDGNGNIWWQNSCKTNKKLVRYNKTNLLLIYIRLLNINFILSANFYFFLIFLCFSLLQPCKDAPTVCII